MDAATGELLWRYKRKLPPGFTALHNTSRGVALYGDKVFLPALDAVLVALDAKTGKVDWEAKVADWKDGYYMTMAPLIVKGKVLVGVAGGEFGIRGFVEAFDAETGKSAWKSYSIPAPGEPGSETWEKPDTWKTGGGAMWMTGNYDPATNTVYWGVGNGSPWFGDQRPGDNLYTASTVALDGDTGKIKGHFQYQQNESWDWDAMNAPMLVDFQRGGATKGLLTPQRNGYIYWLSRNGDGSISYLDSEAYVPQDVFKSIDPKTGRPDVDLAHKPGTGKAAKFCPGLWGGKDWPYESYNPKTGMLYIPSNENHCNNLEGKVEQRIPGQWWTGVAIPDFHFSVDTKAGFFGELQAYDVEHRQANVARSVLELDELGFGADHRRRPAVRRRHQRPDVPRLRRQDGRRALALPHQLRHHRAAVNLRGQRRAICRGRVRLRRRSSVPADLDGRLGRLEPGRAAGRGRLGVRRSEVNGAAPTRRRRRRGQPPELDGWPLSSNRWRSFISRNVFMFCARAAVIRGVLWSGSRRSCGERRRQARREEPPTTVRL